MGSHRGRHLVASVGIAAVTGAGIGFLLGTALAEARSGSAAPVAAAVAARTAPAPVLPVQFRSAAAALSSDEANNIEIYQKYNEGVVNISALMAEHHWFLNAVPRYGSGAGSGTVIDREGHILTNYHVVGGAREVSVTLAGGEERDGRVIGVDPENDLAVIKLDPRGLHLTVIPFGRSADLLVGQKVLAIGNPFALSRTLTTGVVSGLGRPVRADSGAIIQEMIQTDASVNPGNSGGPLLNSRGEMIGITTTIISPSGGSVGIGFAVPIDTARRVLPELIRHGEVRRGWIDVRPVQLFPRLVRQLNLPVERGILVSEAIAGGNAAAAGLRGGDQPVRWGRSVFRVGGDIIVAVDGTATDTIADLFNALEDNKPGDRVEVVYQRGARRRATTVVLSRRARHVQEYFS
ncbi:MAG: trypsin-like peptidase domain-containing protein [Spirochaetaceae bacterium]|nr:trypsin-like peptidase domain-containing protein [Spirochaetaceae bacterium]